MCHGGHVAGASEGDALPGLALGPEHPPSNPCVPPLRDLPMEAP